MTVAGGGRGTEYGHNHIIKGSIRRKREQRDMVARSIASPFTPEQTHEQNNANNPTDNEPTHPTPAPKSSDKSSSRPDPRSARTARRSINDRRPSTIYQPCPHIMT